MIDRQTPPRRGPSLSVVHSCLGCEYLLHVRPGALDDEHPDELWACTEPALMARHSCPQVIHAHQPGVCRTPSWCAYRTEES